MKALNWVSSTEKNLWKKITKSYCPKMYACIIQYLYIIIFFLPFNLSNEIFYGFVSRIFSIISLHA